MQELIVSPSDALARLLPDFGKQLAIDSTIVLAYSNPDKQTKAGGLSDPEASWTTKSYKKGAHLEGKESSKEWFFGYKLHILDDSFWELPIAVKVTTAKESDSPHLIPLLRKAREQHQWPYSSPTVSGSFSLRFAESLERGILYHYSIDREKLHYQSKTDSLLMAYLPCLYSFTHHSTPRAGRAASQRRNDFR